MPRLFIALDLPEDVTAGLERLCEGLPGMRWVEADQFHLTLRFIGEVDQGTFYEIGEALARVSHPPFELALTGLGQFPPGRTRSGSASRTGPARSRPCVGVSSGC
jgi:2'-5' RNA ligase